MNCYAVIDTNVFVSALLSSNENAATVQVIEKFITGEISLVYSKKIMDEYRDVLNRKKFSFPKNDVEYILSAVDHYGIFVDPSPTGMTLADIKDLPFYEVVMEKRDNNAYLVTGKLKHFPKEPFIVTARQLIEILNG